MNDRSMDQRGALAGFYTVGDYELDLPVSTKEGMSIPPNSMHVYVACTVDEFCWLLNCDSSPSQRENLHITLSCPSYLSHTTWPLINIKRENFSSSGTGFMLFMARSWWPFSSSYVLYFSSLLLWLYLRHSRPPRDTDGSSLKPDLETGFKGPNR